MQDHKQDHKQDQKLWKDSTLDQGVHDKNKTAIALTYAVDEKAPRIIATGKGYLAEKIIQSAKEAAIPVHQDDRLANTLSKLDIGDYIPEELYQVVAEVLLFVDHMDRIKGKVMDK